MPTEHDILFKAWGGSHGLIGEAGGPTSLYFSHCPCATQRFPDWTSPFEETPNSYCAWNFAFIFSSMTWVYIYIYILSPKHLTTYSLLCVIHQLICFQGGWLSKPDQTDQTMRWKSEHTLKGQTRGHKAHVYSCAVLHFVKCNICPDDLCRLQVFAVSHLISGSQLVVESQEPHHFFFPFDEGATQIYKFIPQKKPKKQMQAHFLSFIVDK